MFGAYPSTSADTWYPSLGSDGRLYSRFADGSACTNSASSDFNPPSGALLQASVTPLLWFWSPAALDNVLTTSAFPPEGADYKYIGVSALASASNTTAPAMCELALFRGQQGTREYWTTCGDPEAAQARAANYSLVAWLGAYLPLNASLLPPPAPPGPHTSAVNMPPTQPQGWVPLAQLFSAARGDHYATPIAFPDLPDGYITQRKQGFVFVSLPECAAAQGESPAQGWAVLEGDNPFDLEITRVGNVPHPPFTASASFPGPKGVYPSTSFVFRDQWIYGFYLLADPAGSGCGNWCHLGPLIAFGVANMSNISAWSFENAPYWGGTAKSDVDRGVFEAFDVTQPIRMGVPRFVDFGADNTHSPDGRAYLLGKGCAANDGIHCSFMTGDSAFLARTVAPLASYSSLSLLNLASSWEFWGGAGAAGWVSNISHASALFSWPRGVGGLTMTYNPILHKYLVVSNLPSDRVHPTNCSFDTYLLEADNITGPYRLVSYMASLGPQMYFQHLASKFFSADGLTGVLFSSGNWDGRCVTQGSNPPGERYGLVTTEMTLLRPGARE